MCHVEKWIGSIKARETGLNADDHFSISPGQSSLLERRIEVRRYLNCAIILTRHRISEVEVHDLNSNGIFDRSSDSQKAFLDQH